MLESQASINQPLLNVIPWIHIQEWSLNQMIASYNVFHSCVRTTLFEWRYLFKTQPLCLSIRLDGTPVPNRYMCSYHLPAKPLSGVCVYIHSGLSCLSDVDECSERQRCAQQCVNTAGSYRCACREGFALAGDGRSCQSLPPPSPPPATPTSSSQSRQATVGVSHHTDAGKWPG